MFVDGLAEGILLLSVLLIIAFAAALMIAIFAIVRLRQKSTVAILTIATAPFVFIGALKALILLG
jgi:hypothetical protein